MTLIPKNYNMKARVTEDCFNGIFTGLIKAMSLEDLIIELPWRRDVIYSRADPRHS